MIPIPLPYQILAAVLTSLVLFVAGYGYGHHISDQSWRVAIADQKIDAARQLAAAQKYNAEVVQKYNDLNIKVETDHAAAAAEIQDAYDANRKLVDRLSGMLRDKGGRTGGANPVPAVAGPASSGSSATAGCRFPETLGADLAVLARDADFSAAYGQACHAYAVGLKP